MLSKGQAVARQRIAAPTRRGNTNCDVHRGRGGYNMLAMDYKMRR